MKIFESKLAIQGFWFSTATAKIIDINSGCILHWAGNKSWILCAGPRRKCQLFFLFSFFTFIHSNEFFALYSTFSCIFSLGFATRIRLRYLWASVQGIIRAEECEYINPSGREKWVDILDQITCDFYLIVSDESKGRDKGIFLAWKYKLELEVQNCVKMMNIG